MPADRFDVIFRGKLLEDQDPAQVKLKVGRLFKANDAQLQRLFSGKPVSIKQGVDMEGASRYRLAFRQAGALVEIRASRQPAHEQAAPAAVDSNFSLAPANTGSLEDYAAGVEPEPLPDISNLSLAVAGSDHEQPVEATAPDIATDQLDLVPGQEWTLEDCQPLPLPEVELDLSGLELAAPGDDSHIPPEPPAAPLPDISELSLETVKNDENDKE